MTPFKFAIKLIAACAISAAYFSTYAAGSHAGGHEEANVGQAGKAENVSRTVKVKMTDSMRFTPASISVKQGETIRFVVTNAGQIKHEMVLGTEKELKEHNEVMKKNPVMEHADNNMITLAPGKSGDIVWQFTQAGKVNFACLQPDHYDAGMKGAVKVAANKAMATTAKTAANPSPALVPPQTAVAAAVPTPVKTSPANNATSPKLEMTNGEVRKIDKDSGKITLKHGDIKNLDMPAMTMAFKVSDPKLLDLVKVGDTVDFRAEKVNGQFTVTDIETARK